MASPTSLVPTALVSKLRRNSRHAVPEDPIVRGTMRGPSTSPEAREAPQGLAHGSEAEKDGVRNKGKQPVYESEVEFLAELGTGKGAAGVRRMSVVSLAVKEESDDEGQDLCVICLQAVRDPTIVGECGHQIFCFECINVWANQSRKCPLCTRAMAPFLLHELDSPVGPTKFYLPPLPTIRPNPATAPLPPARPPRFRRPRPSAELGYSNRDGLVGRHADLWARVKRESRGMGEDDLLERAVERRREVYTYGLYAKHIASNTFTRFKPSPTPCQFAENKETIARATSFIRRELRVWRHLDVEFLTTYIVSLMKSIDIRSEPAVRLLADFLDERGSTGRDRRGAEQFAHEVYSFLRSPYRDLALYDAIVQYDPVPVQYSDSGSGSEDEGVAVRRHSSVRDEDAGKARSEVPVQARASKSRRHRSRSPDSDSSDSIRSLSPPADRRKRARLSPRKWNRADSYVPVRRESDARKWNRRDSWVNKEAEAGVKRKVENGRAPQVEAVLIPERHAEHRGMRGWDETVSIVDEPSRVETGGPAVEQNKVETKPIEEAAKPSLELRIFGIAGRAAQDGARLSAKASYDTDDEDRALESAIWAADAPNQGLKVEEIGRSPQVAAGDQSRIQDTGNRENSSAEMAQEKSKHTSSTGRPTEVDAPIADPSVSQRTTVTEAEAKVKARLQLKLRLEREKAEAAAKAKQEGTTNTPEAPTDRAAVLRAKLLEKKMAASRVR